jgi:DNA polymerase III subunit delta'
MNWDMIGHEWAVTLLKGQITRGQLRHAYLITGPQGVGRRTLALRLAQALNCPNPAAPGEPCGNCLTCRQIARMQYPDLNVVQAEQIGGVLKVDQVRELQRNLALAPYQGKFRVALLLRFEEAHPSAANALLKSLEEPPPSVIMVVTAESKESLLETISSRCEEIRLRPMSLEATARGLAQRWDIPADTSRLLAHLSNGRIGYAVWLHENPEYLQQRTEWLNDFTHLQQETLPEQFRYAETNSRDRSSLRRLILVWLSYWRDILLVISGAKCL